MFKRSTPGDDITAGAVTQYHNMQCQHSGFYAAMDSPFFL